MAIPSEPQPGPGQSEVGATPNPDPASAPAVGTADRQSVIGPQPAPGPDPNTLDVSLREMAEAFGLEAPPDGGDEVLDVPRGVFDQFCQDVTELPEDRWSDARGLLGSLYFAPDDGPL